MVQWVGNLPASAEDKGPIHGPRRFHMPRSSLAHALQRLSRFLELWAATTEPMSEPMRPKACALRQEKPLLWEPMHRNEE